MAKPVKLSGFIGFEFFQGDIPNKVGAMILILFKKFNETFEMPRFAFIFWNFKVPHQPLLE